MSQYETTDYLAPTAKRKLESLGYDIYHLNIALGWKLPRHSLIRLFSMSSMQKETVLMVAESLRQMFRERGHSMEDFSSIYWFDEDSPLITHAMKRPQTPPHLTMLPEAPPPPPESQGPELYRFPETVINKPKLVNWRTSLGLPPLEEVLRPAQQTGPTVDPLGDSATGVAHADLT